MSPLLKEKKSLDTIPRKLSLCIKLIFYFESTRGRNIAIVLNNIAIHYLEECYQFAYREFNCTETALNRLFSNLLIHIVKSKAVLPTMLDRNAAFDTVNHITYLRRLHDSLGVMDGAFDWMTSYMCDRRARANNTSLSLDSWIVPYLKGHPLPPLVLIVHKAPRCRS